MKNKYLEKIEFYKIIDTLSQYAVTYEGQNACLNLLPIHNKGMVEKALQETTEASILMLRKGTPPLAPICDITTHEKTIASQGTLSIKQLLDLASILKISRELKEYIKSDIDVSFSTIVSNYFEKLYSNVQIENTIFTAILDEHTIEDKASQNLYNIRKQIRNIEQDIRNKLNSLLNSKYIQEPIVTIRNNRYVVPVKQEYRGEIKGLLHDTSASGSTLFIEPLSVFELNNTLNNLKTEENYEIEIILAQLTSLFTPIVNELKNTIYAIGKIDFAFAKAKYSNTLNATEPIINSKKEINLINARHPLIDPNKIVPININLGTNFNTLVITGPNTGGKTVTLKTTGLLTAMAMSGLYIPASEKSSIYVFDNIYADIGDDQSIAQSLSTFSSHMTHIIEIINNSTTESLILIDELGSGTDPIEGSSLAISILDYLAKQNILTLATTHYPEVKNFALVNPKFENASSEFDLTTLSPTYRLIIGVPGKSMAFAISEKLGLNKQIIEDAQKQINNETVNIEELLKNIYEDKIVIQNEKEKIEKYSKEISLTKEILEKRELELKEKEQSIISDAKLKARNILLEAKEESDEIIKELQHISSTTQASKVRENLNAKIKQLKPNKSIINSQSLTSENIKEGMYVFVNSLQQDAIVLSKPNKSNMVNVQIGNLKTNIPVTNLSPSSKEIKTVNKTSVKTSTHLNSKNNMSSEINVIGLNIDEATFLIDKFLDDAALCHLSSVRIVHGKGTGILRKGIHQFLNKNKHVSSFRMGTFGEGEMGVTIVEIK